MPRTALLEPPYTDQVDALLARMTPGSAADADRAGTRDRHRPDGALCGHEYEWGVHMVTFAERVGFVARTARIPHGPGAPRFADFAPRTR